MYIQEAELPVAHTQFVLASFLFAFFHNKVQYASLTYNTPYLCILKWPSFTPIQYSVRLRILLPRPCPTVLRLYSSCSLS